MSIYIGNDLEDRLKALEIENASLKNYNLEDRLKTLKMAHISFAALTSIIRRQLFALPSD